MIRKNRKMHLYFLDQMILLLSLALFLVPVSLSSASAYAAEAPKIDNNGIRLVIDGRDISASVAPMIVNDRAVVPVRVISEELGAAVRWDDISRTVYIEKGDRSVLLRIDKYLVEYDVDGSKSYGLSDVAPKIYSDRTFVPLRLISNALGVGISWDDATRTVAVDSDIRSDIVSFFNMKIDSVTAGNVIGGNTALHTSIPDAYAKQAASLHYLLLEPGTGSGFTIAKTTDPEETASWLPSVNDHGDKILVAGLYDAKGVFLCGDAIPINVNVSPVVSLTGLFPNQIVTDSISIGAAANFAVAYIKYEFINTDNGKSFTTSPQDPAGQYQWDPKVEFNGNVTIQAYAYDEYDRPYPSDEFKVRVLTSGKISLNGISTGKLIDHPITLSVSRNFDAIETEYWLRDPGSSQEVSLLKTDFGNLTWFPGTEMAGVKEVLVRAKSADGTLYSSASIPITVTGDAKLYLFGIGPGQVLSAAKDGTNAPRLKAVSNVTLKSVRYLATEETSGRVKTLAEYGDMSKEFIYIPTANEAGKWRIKAIGTVEGGPTLQSDEIPITIYSGEIHSAKPIIDKSKYLDMASVLAVDDWKQSGMSAALQTAQSILETGWGQSVPVDKYNGKFSYNLFGIKGSGPAGSVVSNTWEEYNGVSYRIDANFRAYHNVSESWRDHNNLLMTKDRYSSYREVMFDSTQGAWALKRAGYATDSQYPVKLIKIITQYNLKELDRVSI